ncbi:MAG: hypothetical protein U0793_21190 [Gemmataceae bacterium]
MRVLAIVLAVLPTLAQAQDKEKRDPAPKRLEPGKEQTSRTSHSVTIAGKKIDYDAVAGTLQLKEEDGKASASIFYIAYTKTGADPKDRPILFSFNGGPGSSSVWLHLGVFGPKRVVLSDAGEAPAPPGRLVDNAYSILDQTDLVFIDPVSTGYSRAAEEKEAKKFHGVEEDVQAVAEFIRLYTTRNDRWQSPRFLAGESYGTTRAAAVAPYLQSRHGMRLNGILLVSVVLNFETLSFAEGNDLPYPLFLPSYTATAWHHKRLDSTLQADLKKALAEVERFAVNDYSVALLKGAALSDKERLSVAHKLAFFTGVSTDYVLRSDLRLEAHRFMQELLRDQGYSVGRFDSRIKGKSSPIGERPETDFSYHAVQGPYTEAFNHYVRKELKFESDMPYEILTGRVQPWNYGKAATNRYLNVAPRLKEALTTNAALKVFVANGYYDLATPYFATEYTFNHLGGERALLDRVEMKYYRAGHMMYIHQPSLREMREDVAAFLMKAK